MKGRQRAKNRTVIKRAYGLYDNPIQRSLNKLKYVGITDEN